MLSVLLVVLVAAYALLLFILTFFADLNSVDSLRFSAVFMLIAAVVTFGVLMFFGSGTMLEPLEEEDESMAVDAQIPTTPSSRPSLPAVCASCGQENPAGANFCYACGATFAPDPVKEEAVTQQTSITKSELLSRLQDGGADALKRLRAMPEDSFEAGRYENGWNARQILAHIASIEWTYPRLIDNARGGDAPQPPKSEPPTPAAPSERILSYNDRQVEKRADDTVAQLLDELDTNRAATIAAVEAADEELFSRPVRSAGGAQGTLAEVLNYVAVQHVAMHVDDITTA